MEIYGRRYTQTVNEKEHERKYDINHESSQMVKTFRCFHGELAQWLVDGGSNNDTVERMPSSSVSNG